MNDLLIMLYLDNFRLLKRGNYRGVISNAKPYFIITIINAIETRVLSNNCIYIDDITPLFKNVSRLYSPTEIPTPSSYPFYHLHTECFYHLNWIGNPLKVAAPSIKWVKEHIHYAYLDNALWDLLQNKENRDYFRKSIEDYYLK